MGAMGLTWTCLRARAFGAIPAAANLFGADEMTVRVAIIGAGPSGLAQLRAFESARKAGAGCA